MTENTDEDERFLFSIDNLGRDKSLYIASAAIILVFMAVGVFYLGGVDNLQDMGPIDQPDQEDEKAEQKDDKRNDTEQNDTEDTDDFSEYATSSEKSFNMDVEETAEADASYIINEYGIKSDVESIGVGDVVEFINGNNFTVRLEFDSSNRTQKLQKGDSVKIKFRAITQVTVYEHSKDRIIGFTKVNVQY
jgi:hypothetical protein